MKAVYEDLENASGNDLLDEQERLWLVLAGILKDAKQDVQILTDFEDIVNELAKREER